MLLRVDYKFLCNHRIHTCSSVTGNTIFWSAKYTYFQQDCVCGILTPIVPFLVRRFGIVSINISMLFKVKRLLLLLSIANKCYL
jgi:hypothetical protein